VQNILYAFKGKLYSFLTDQINKCFPCFKPNGSLSC